MIKFFPFIVWLRNYKKEYLSPDLIAGITLGTVLVPQSMAYAMLAGLPPIYGLYAAAITPIIGTLWGKSGILAVGPLALASLLTATALAPLANPESPEYIAMAIMLAFMVGTIFILMGAFKLGFIFRFMSYPVVVGIISAIAIIIALSQVRHLLGIPVPRTEYIYQMLIETARNIPDTNPYVVALSLLCFVIIYGGNRIHQYFPGALIAAIVTTLLVYFFDLREFGVRTVGDMPAGLPIPAVPYMGIDVIFSLISAAITIAIIGFVQVVALTKVIAMKNGQKADLNQELIGHGAANVIGSFFQSHPVTSSASRTALNLHVGGKTGVSVIISGLIVILTLLFLTSLFYYLPRAALGAIVFAAAISIIQFNPFTKIYKISKLDGSAALATFVFALMLTPTYAIFIGVALSVILFFRTSITPRIAVMTRNPQTETFADAEAAKLPSCPQMLYLRPDSAIYFANAGHIRDGVLDLVMERKDGLKYVLIDFEAVNNIDTTGLDELTSLIKDLEQFKVELYIVNINASIREIVYKSGLMNLMGHNLHPDSKGASIAMLFDKIDHKYCKDVCPYKIFRECETVK